MEIRNSLFLLLTGFFLLFILLNLQSFLDNVWFYASGSAIAIAIKGQWWFAALNIVIFLSLLLFLNRKKANWKTHGLFSAFIISLFAEMYGAALAIYFLAGGPASVSRDTAPAHGVLFSLNFFGITLGFDFWMTF